MECTETVAEILLDRAIGKPLDYRIPSSLFGKVKRGAHVQVPLRGRLCHGYVQKIKKDSPFPRLLPIHGLLAEEVLSEELFSLALWMSHYYVAPIERVLKIMLPSSVRESVGHKTQHFVERAQTIEALREECRALRGRRDAQARVLEAMLGATKGMLLTELLEKAGTTRAPIDALASRGLLRLAHVQLDRSPLADAQYFRTLPKALTSEQQQSLDKILQSIEDKRFKTHLLFGVTGSGKTEVYLQAIERALSFGLGAIMLVPEIALTAQTIERFRSRFESSIAILHHRLSKGERFDEWQRIRQGKAPIVIGARSAVFSPVPNLALIIVDEEQESAYKQSEESPCYHARDVAVMRGKLSGATVVLGSATPSLESFENARKGKYTLTQLTTRADAARLPQVTVVDMNKEFERANGYTSFSEPLLEAIKMRAARGEQAILFLNRRGYHTSLVCKGCGHLFKCPHCDLALTFHHKDNALSCHLCDRKESPPPSVCPICRTEQTLKFRGVGTEQIERSLHAVLPEVRTLRIDADTTRHKGSHERLFRAFSTGKSDVLIGTQMVAKGLHFPSVTLVAILNADGGLHIPDFRASEQVFRLITQVAGRAGRGALAGEVIIQTHMPDHETIVQGSRQDYPCFFASEIEVRKLFGYPPFSHLVKCTFSGIDPEKTLEACRTFRQGVITGLGGAYAIHPSVPCGHPKIKDLYRFHFLIRGPNPLPMVRQVEKVQSSFPLPRSVRLLIDVDPLSTYF